MRDRPATQEPQSQPSPELTPPNPLNQKNAGEEPPPEHDYFTKLYIVINLARILSLPLVGRVGESAIAYIPILELFFWAT